ncbi:unknown [Bifidobacterium bifidum CAG:234]|nr:unknown [Bifidobacterium bifidum CAG:234]
MASSDVGQLTYRTPRIHVAATKPARSVAAPPPTPTTASERVKPSSPSRCQMPLATSIVLPASASGITMSDTW